MCFRKEWAWIACDGKYKSLLRSGWIVISITTLLIFAAGVLLHWPPTRSKLTLETARNLIMVQFFAALLIYFFGVFLSLFVIVECSVIKSSSSVSSSGDSRTEDTNRDVNDPLETYEQIPLSTIAYSDGFRQVSPNNAQPPSPPHQFFQNPENNTTVNATVAPKKIWCRYTTIDRNEQDRHIENQMSPHSSTKVSQVENVPEIVITRPDNSMHVYEHIDAQDYQYPSPNQNNVCPRTTGEFQKTLSDLANDYSYKSYISKPSAAEKQTSKTPVSQAMSRKTDNDPITTPLSSQSNNYFNRSNAIKRYEDKKRALDMSLHQAETNSRRCSNSSEKLISNRYESHVDRSGIRENQVQTSDMSMHQEEIRYSNLTNRSVSCRYDGNGDRYGMGENQTSEMYNYQEEINQRRYTNPTNRSVSCRYEGPVDRSRLSENQTSEKSRQSEINSRRYSNSNDRPISPRYESYVDRSGLNENRTLEMSLHQTMMNSRNAKVNSSINPVYSGYVGPNNNFEVNANEKHALEMPMLQAERPRRATSYDVLSESGIKCSKAFDKYKNQPSNINRSFESVIEGPQLVENQSRRYSVDRLPASANYPTRMLMAMVSGSAHFLEDPSIELSTINSPKTSDLTSTKVTHV